MTTGSREPESGGVRTPPLFPFFLFFFFFPSLFSVEFGSTLSVLSPSMLHCFKLHVDFGGGVSCSAHSGRFFSWFSLSFERVYQCRHICNFQQFLPLFLTEWGIHITAQHQGEEEKQKLQKAQARKRPQVWMWLHVDFNWCQTRPHRSDD